MSMAEHSSSLATWLCRQVLLDAFRCGRLRTLGQLAAAPYALSLRPTVLTSPGLEEKNLPDTAAQGVGDGDGCA